MANLGTNFMAGPSSSVQSQMQTMLDSGPVSESVSEPVGNTYRGFLSDWFNGRGKAKEDWMRNEQAAINAFNRESAFNSAEAQKQRDWEEHMSNTAYQRAVEDMKKAGINPVLAVSSGGASTPSGSSASASSSGHKTGGRYDDGTQFLMSIMSLLAGMYTSGASNATRLATSGASNATKMSVATLNNDTKMSIAQMYKKNNYRRK